MIGYDAIRYYFKQYSSFIVVKESNIAQFDREFLSYRFIPVFRRNSYYDLYDIYLHIPSIVAFCHRYNPEQFADLTSTDIYELLSRNYVAISHNNSYKSFCVITEKEFKDIIDGGKENVAKR